jgi:hypothetical protein
MFSDDVIEQNLTAEEFHRQSVRRPRTLSISPSMQLPGSAASGSKMDPANLATPYQAHHRSSVFAAVAPTISAESESGNLAVPMTAGSVKQQKKLNLQIAQELSDLVNKQDIYFILDLRVTVETL